MLRAIANALWPHLRRNRWRTHTVTRDLSKSNPRGYQAGPKSATVAQAPSASAVIELHHEEFITAILYGEDWPGGTSHALMLDQLDYAHVIGSSQPNDSDAFDTARRVASCRAPFHAQANRHGVMGLRRNGTDEYITAAVATVLERIAAATKVLPIDEADINDALIRDDEISLNALGYTLERQGAM